MDRLQRYGFILLALYIFLVTELSQASQQIGLIHHIFLTALAVTWLIYRLIKGRGLPPTSLSAPIILFLGLAVIVNVFSERPRIGFEAFWDIVIAYVGFLFIVNAFQHRQRHTAMVAVFFVIFITVLINLYYVGSIIFGLGLGRVAGQGWIEFIGAGIAFPWQSELRINLPFTASTVLAAFVGVLIVIVITWAISVKHTLQRVLLWLLAFPLVMVLLFTQSRAGLLSVSVGVVILFLLNQIKSLDIRGLFTRRGAMLGMGVIAVLGITIAIVLTISSRGGRRSGDSVRLDLWRSAVVMITDDPLTGVGTGQFGGIHREQWTYETARSGFRTPDNMYLFLLSEHGVLIIPIALWAAWIIGRKWWALREQVPVDSAEWIRLNGMMAALLTFLGHRVFDSIIGLQHMMLFSIVVAYCIIDVSKAPPHSASRTNRVLATGLIGVLVAYSIWTVGFIAPAHQHFINSNDPEFDSRREVQRAIALDPHFNMYQLQLAYIDGQVALDNPTPETLDIAINAYLNALELEPTWNVGMVNLAALYEADDDPEQALLWLQEAYEFIRDSNAHIQWARIAETSGLADDPDIIANYVRGMALAPYLPLSEFWGETGLRQQAVLAYSEQLPLDRQYRIFQVHAPDTLDSLVPDNPQSAAEWWVVGEHALTINGDIDLARQGFTNAIDLRPNYGDYYASRAQTYPTAAQAERDLQIAQFLGTTDEYLNLVRLQFADDAEQIEQLRQTAIPSYFQISRFSLSVFNRVHQFLIYDPVRQIGRGDTVMNVLYDLAEQYEADGEIDNAIDIYQRIVLQAPEDDRAVAEIERLEQTNE